MALDTQADQLRADYEARREAELRDAASRGRDEVTTQLGWVCLFCELCVRACARLRACGGGLRRVQACVRACIALALSVLLCR